MPTDQSFFNIKKYAHGKRGYLREGGWEAIHVIQVGPDEEGMAHYCLTSTIMLSLTTDSDTSGTFNLSGSIRRQMKADLSVEDGHLCNMGKMIEELEGKLRNQLDVKPWRSVSSTLTMETDIRQKDEKSSKNDKTEHRMEKRESQSRSQRPKSQSQD
ncbi:probable F-actin-capping protein subunit beta [Tanacetum coccineum]